MSGAGPLLSVRTIKTDDPLLSGFGATLREYEARIKANERDSIEARWHFGKALLGQRQGKLLPKGVLAAVCAEHDLSEREIQYRMRFAETCTTKDALRTAMRSHKTWDAIKREVLPKKTATPRRTMPPARLEVRRLGRTIKRLSRDQVEASDPGLYADLDHLYDALVAFFNAQTIAKEGE